MRRFGLEGLKRLGDKIDQATLALIEWLKMLPTLLFGNTVKRPSTKAFMEASVDWSGKTKTWLRGKNPHQDLDLTVSTDCEDLAAFSNDVLEFIEQDRSLLLDSLTDLGFSTLALVTAVGGAKVLSSRLLKRKK